MTSKLLNHCNKEVTNSSHLVSFRIKITYPFKSEMTLIQLNETLLKEESSDIIIENIGPGGLRFVSNIPLEVEQEIIYSFDAEVIGETIHFPGVIIWNEELSEGLYQYGVHFRLPESTKTFLNQLLNEYSKRYFSLV